jgi:hypothetical protein
MSKCGSLPPLFNTKECDEWFSQFMQRKLEIQDKVVPAVLQRTSFAMDTQKPEHPAFNVVPVVMYLLHTMTML